MRGTRGWEGEEAASLLANVTWAENTHLEETQAVQLWGGVNNPARMDQERPGWSREGSQEEEPDKLHRTLPFLLPAPPTAFSGASQVSHMVHFTCRRENML